MEIIGKVIHCEKIRRGTSKTTGKEWQSVEFVVETIGQYPKKAVLSIFGEDRVKEFGKFCNPKLYENNNKQIKVQFDIDAREYNGRYYNDLKVWKIEEYTESSESTEEPTKPSNTETKPNPQPIQEQGDGNGNDDNDLPF